MPRVAALSASAPAAMMATATMPARTHPGLDVTASLNSNADCVVTVARTSVGVMHSGPVRSISFGHLCFDDLRLE